MSVDFLEYLFNGKNLPAQIDSFNLKNVEFLSDGALQIHYASEENVFGFFTITLYNGGVLIPDNLNDPILQDQFEECKRSIAIMEERKIYQNVKVLLEEPFYFDKDEYPTFLSIILAYLRNLNNEELIPEISFLLLRSDNGYFNKVRYSKYMIDEDEDDTFMVKMNNFLAGWVKFISLFNKAVN